MFHISAKIGVGICTFSWRSKRRIKENFATRGYVGSNIRKPLKVELALFPDYSMSITWCTETVQHKWYNVTMSKCGWHRRAGEVNYRPPPPPPMHWLKMHKDITQTKSISLDRKTIWKVKLLKFSRGSSGIKGSTECHLMLLRVVNISKQISPLEKWGESQ